MTGLLNRRGLWRRVPELVAAAVSGRQVLAVLAVDLDHFKRVNDRFGHDAGDALLSAVGSGLREVVRRSDLVARLGGEELAVVGRFANEAEAAAAGDRLRRCVAEFQVAGVPPVTASVGVVMCAGEDLRHEPGEVVSRLLTLGDQALYRAKAMGRDRVEVLTAQPVTNA